MMRFLLACLLALACGQALATSNILVFGDSLSAGYGLAAGEAWPDLLAHRLQANGFDYSVVNASISGETTAGGRARLAAALAQHRPAIVILELGANDGLRGLPLTQTRDNLTAMVRDARRSGARVLLVSMRLPPNYGGYARQFEALFGEVASREQAVDGGFLLAGVAAHPELFQADQLHPIAAAQARLLDNVWHPLTPLLAKKH
jgi:acyl-CoA thioesterase I